MRFTQTTLRKALTRSQAHLRSVISWRSRLPFFAWRAGLLPRVSRSFVLISGEKVIFRPPPATDAWTATEVFGLEDYRPPEAVKKVRRIVDLGANVGFTSLYFARRFPEALIDAFEPHPIYLRQLHTHLRINALEDRVQVHPFAAGSRTEDVFLTDSESTSTVVPNKVHGAISISKIDWFGFALTKQIDLLKMDIEGGEYEILFDPRFRKLSIPYIVLEWHAGSDRPFGDKEIIKRLTELNYTIRHVADRRATNLRYGLLWALLAGEAVVVEGRSL